MTMRSPTIIRRVMAARWALAQKFVGRTQARAGPRRMPYAKGLKRVIPKATVALAIDEDATSRETFPEEAHFLARGLRAGFERNADATEAVVHVIRSHEIEAERFVAMGCGLSEEDVSRVLRRVAESSARRPFERRSLVHSFHLDSAVLSVEIRQGTGDMRARCWDERCCEADVRPEAGFALSFQARESRKPHTFSCRAEVHHWERAERLTVDMTGGVALQVDVLDHGRGFRASLSVPRGFSYRAACRGIKCLLAASDGAPSARPPGAAPT